MGTGIGAINAASPKMLKGGIGKLNAAKAGSQANATQQAGAKQDVLDGGSLSPPKAKTNAANLGSQLNFSA